MKRLLALLLILMVSLYAGCLTDPADEDNGDDLNGGNNGGDNGGNGGGGFGSGPALPSDYLPLTGDRVWTFEEVVSDGNGNSTTGTFTFSTNGTANIDGHTWYAIDDSREENDLYFRFDGSAIYRYDPEMDLSVLQSPAKPAAIEKTEGEEYLWIDFGAATFDANGVPNMATWEIFSYVDDNTNIHFMGNYYGQGFVFAMDEEHSDVLTFSFQFDEYYYTPENDSYYSQIYTIMIARDIGPIMIDEFIQEWDGVTEINYTSRAVLSDYTVDGVPWRPDDDDGIIGGGDGNAGTHAFLPFKDGATWTYEETEKDYWDDNTSSWTYTSVIDGTAVVDGETYWYFSDSDGQNDLVRIENGVVYTITPDDIISDMVGVSKTAVWKQAAAEVDDLPDEIPFLKLNANEGQSWDILNYSSNVAGTNISISWTGRFVDVESITVPAGTFTNARKYEFVTDMSTTYDGETYAMVMTEHLWLAENVGMVRSIVRDRVDGDTVFEDDSVLTSYSIP